MTQAGKVAAFLCSGPKNVSQIARHLDIEPVDAQKVVRRMRIAKTITRQIAGYRNGQTTYIYYNADQEHHSE